MDLVTETRFGDNRRKDFVGSLRKQFRLILHMSILLVTFGNRNRRRSLYIVSFENGHPVVVHKEKVPSGTSPVHL